MTSSTRQDPVPRVAAAAFSPALAPHPGAGLFMPAPPVSAAVLHAHADAIEHAAAVGGYALAAGDRRTLSAPERSRWAADAAVLREAAYALEVRSDGL